MLCSLVIACIAARWLARSRRNPFGLRFRRSTIPIILGGLLAMALARSLAAYLAVGSGAAIYESAAGPGALVGGFAMALAVGAVPALAEDILTRGFPLFAARSARPAWVLIVVSAAMYALNHIWRFDWGVTEQLRLFCMGIAYAVAAWRLQTLWAAFALHLGWNAGSALVPLDIVNSDAFRLGTAAIHMAIAALLMLIPRRQPDS